MTYQERTDFAELRRRELIQMKAAPRKHMGEYYCHIHDCVHDGTCLLCKTHQPAIRNRNTWKTLPTGES